MTIGEHEPGSPEFSPPMVRDGKVVQGKDGWLFLAGDRNQVLAQHAGERVLDAGQLEGWKLLLERRRGSLGQRGIKYLFAVAPDKEAIYQDKLPEGVKHVKRRPVNQLREHLARVRSSVEVVYPLAELMEARSTGQVCSKYDSHWNDLGAFVAYSRLAAELEDLVRMRRLNEEEVKFTHRQKAVGDLGYKVGAESAERLLVASLPNMWARPLSDNEVRNSGSVISTMCPGAPGSCMLFGDSSAWALLKYMAESFGRLTYVHSSTLDMELVERERPDVVVNLVMERFLVEVPDDESGPSVATQEARKLASGEVRQAWRWPYVPPLEAVPSRAVVDRMRAQLTGEGRLGDATIVSALANAGLRQGEVCGLRWRDVQEDRLVIRWGNRDRNVQLMSELAFDLQRWRRSLNGPPRPNAIVFPGRNGKVWARGEWADWVATVYVPVAVRSGASDPRPDLLRHFFASMLIERGAGPQELAAQLGLSVSQVEAVYEPWLVDGAESRP